MRLARQTRRKENLHSEEKKPVRQLPGAAPVATWVEEGGKLLRVVSH